MNQPLTLGQRKVAAAQRPTAAAHWKRTLQNAPSSAFPPDTPTADTLYGNHPADPKGPAGAAGGAGAVTRVPLCPGMAGRLLAVGGGRSDSVRLLLAAATAFLLAESTGDDDVVVGLTAAPGGLAGVLPLRIAVDRQEGFRVLAQRVRDVARSAMTHADFPVDLYAPRPRVVIDAGPDDGAPVAGASVQVHGRIADGGLDVGLRADPARHSPAGAAFLAGHLGALLDAVLSGPDVPLGELDLSTEADADLVRQTNDTSAAPGYDLSLPTLFAVTVDVHGQRTAVRTDDGDHTFAQFDVRARFVTQALTDQGAGPGTVVAVLSRRSVDLLAGIVGVLAAGAAYLPVDPHLPPARVHYLLQDSGAPIVLLEPGLESLVPDEVRIIPLTRAADRDGDDAGTDSPVPPALPGPPAPTDPAYVIYTSGSTGAPKGVVVEHRSVVNRLQWMQRTYPLRPGDVILQKTPVSFDVSVWELFWWLVEGTSVALLPPGAEREPSAVVDAIERHGVTVLHFVPTMLGAFVEFVDATGAAGRLHSVRRIFCSGEALAAGHVRRVAEVLPHVELVNLYGPTEATVDVSHERTHPAAALVTIGRPIDHTRLYVLDAAGRERPVGLPGELHIAGAGLARGYLHRPELTAERFVQDPFPGEARTYRTGDVVRRLPTGAIEYLGRNDSQVKLRGFRIEPGEIESVLARHPGVGDAAVVVRAGADGQRHLHGHVVSGDELSEQELRAFAARHLPEYMVPERICVLAAFPLSANGKLDRAALPEPPTRDGGYVAPRNERERALAGIWSDVLGLDRVGVTDSFFALGGNSIHFVSVLARARAQGMDFTFQQMFSEPTVAGLLASARPAAPGEVAPQEFAPFSLLSEQDRALVPAGVEDGYPMSMLQSGLVYQSELMHGNTGYHDIISYLIGSSLDVGAFREAVRLLVADGPILRTSYHLTGFGEYVQLVHRQVEDLPLVVEDIRHLGSEQAHDAWYAEWFAREQNRPFRWEEPGLVRLHVHLMGDSLFRYSISQHNSALDGWSINQVHVRLFEIYFALVAGKPYARQPLANHLRNFIGLEQQAIRSPEQAGFWRTTLADRPDTRVPRLRPTDPEAPLEVVFHDVDLPAGTSAALVALARDLGAPLKVVLLAAHLKVLSLLSGDPDVLTGYEHAGRPELPDAEKALGVFLNSMPLRVRLAPGSWVSLIRQVYTAEAQALPYRRYPMAQVKQDLATTDLLFETVFNFTHFYSLKQLRDQPGFALLDVRAAAITEFPLRTEFSQHFSTDEVQLSLHHHTRAFDDDHIARIGGYFVAVLRSMVEDVEAAHHEELLLSAAELDELEAFSRAHDRQAQVLDVAGLPVPVGTTGRVWVTGPDGRTHDAGRGRWRPGARLERDSVVASGTAPAVTAAPPQLSEAGRRVAAVWAGVLGGDADRFRPGDDFFAVGGSSLAAMRVLLALEGAVTLRQVMSASRLFELADLLEAGPGPSSSVPDLLVPLTEVPGTPRATVVCVPYAGGNALHFQPLAQALREQDAAVAVLAVEVPGHAPGSTAGELTDFARTGEAIAAAVADRVRGPIVLWGHCVGSALALDVARRLRAAGRDVRHLFLAGKLLPPEGEIRATLAAAGQLTFDDIRDWLVEWTGSEDLGDLGEEYRVLLTRIFRHDSLEANAHLLGLRRDPPPEPLPVPCTVVVAADDAVTRDHLPRWSDWSLAVASPSLEVLAAGGHYFTRTRPDDVARLVLARLTALDTAAGGR